jgi:hypothetical protein
LSVRLQSFSFLCQCLALNQSPETIERLRYEIKRGSVDWESIVQIANEQLVSPALWISLMHKGLHEDLPDELKYYLSGLNNLNLQRNGRIKQQAEEIIMNLNRIGIEPILLKGAALLFTNVFSDPGVRILADLDIMVSATDVEESLKTLSSLGYRVHEPDAPVFEWLHHLPAMIRDGEPTAIELHRQLFSRKHGDIMVLTAEDCFNEATVIKTMSLSFKILSLPHFIIHNIVHSEVQDGLFYKGIVSLRRLLDFAVVSYSHPHAIDWKSIEGKLKEHGFRHIYRSYLHMAFTLLNASVPHAFGLKIGGKFYLKKSCLLMYGSDRQKVLVSWLTNPLRSFEIYGSDRQKVLFSCFTNPVRSFQIVLRDLTVERLKVRFGCTDGIVGLNKTRLKYLWFLFRKYVLNKSKCS